MPTLNHSQPTSTPFQMRFTKLIFVAQLFAFYSLLLTPVEAHTMKEIADRIQRVAHENDYYALEMLLNDVNGFADFEPSSEVRGAKLELFKELRTAAQSLIVKDFHHTPRTIEPPHANLAWVSGMDPAAVKDPALRKTYEAEIAAEEKLSEISNRNHAMRRLVHEINICLIIYCRRAYGTIQAEQNAMRHDLEKWEDAKDLLGKISTPRREQ